MDDNSLFQLQLRLVEVRKIYPNLIEKMYQHIRMSHLKLLKEHSIEESELFDITKEELLPICNNYNTKGDEELSKLLDQTRVMIILAAKKNCKISKIIDAI